MNPKMNFDLPRIAFDYETPLIGTTKIVNLPPPVVLSIFDSSGDNRLFHAKGDDYLDVVEFMLEPGHMLVGHNVAFDLGVLYAGNPNLITKIFDKLERGEVYDTLLAQKLMNLSTCGVITEGFVKGKPVNFRYDLAALAKDWLGVNIDEDKRKPTEEQLEASKEMAKKGKWTDRDIEKWDAMGAWRLRYADLLDFTDIDRWPSNASRYALADSKLTSEIADRQIAIGATRREEPFATLGFQIMCDFACKLRTSLGVYTDQKVVKKVEAWVDENLTDEVLEPLKEAGIYIPAHNGRPHKRNPDKLTKPEKAKIKQEPLKRHIIKLLGDGKIQKKDIRFTPKGVTDTEFREAWKEAENPAELLAEGGRDLEYKYKDITKTKWLKFIDYLSIDKHFQRVIEDLEIDDTVLKNFTHYKKFAGLKSNSIPVMKQPKLHPVFDVLKLTGRLSSKKDSNGSFPSGNIQQIDARIREAYTSRDGHYMMATDYSSMELITAAQTCYNLFGRSVLKDIIEAGYDAHAFLGAQLAAHLDEDFIEYIAENPELAGDTDAIYHVFMETKGTDFFKKYRGLAKPTGLGYWGALGYETFIKTAKTTYFVEVESVEMAELLKNIWHSTFPETAKYFQFVRKHRIDHHNTYSEYDEERKKEMTRTRYVYDTPYGMLRKNCHYTKIANGMSLQSPGSEGSKTSMYLITRACFDPSLENVLYGNYIPWGAIHDEEIGDVVIGKEYEVAVEIDRLMKEGFKYVCPDVPIKTETALMKNWSKKAESKIDHEKKTITLWEPKK